MAKPKIKTCKYADDLYSNDIAVCLWKEFHELPRAILTPGTVFAVKEDCRRCKRWEAKDVPG